MTNNPAPSTIDMARAEARMRWSYASPYRLGIVVGQMDLTATCPYADGSRAAKSFAHGVAWGQTTGTRGGG